MFYEKHGYIPIESKKLTTEGEKDFLDEIAILWKVFDASVTPAGFLRSIYRSI
ncbi:MAG: hypothetical protein ACFFB2_09400 [Promethearchaeota archaeon]